jgi:hypothetical protein
MKGFQTVRGRVSRAVAVLSTAGVLGLAGCGGGTETPKKAAVPTGPAQPLPGQPQLPNVKFQDATNKAAGPKTNAEKAFSKGVH